MCVGKASETIAVDDIDKRILTVIQQEFPLVRRPFADIARRVGLTEPEVIGRIGTLKDNGTIRRIGAVLDARTLGVATTLCAAAVPEARIDEVAAIVNSFRRVTHNYQRDGAFTLWFTVWGKDDRELSATIEEIEQRTGISVTRLDAVKTYKIRAVFDPA
jgi:DNA-binding Lrp family transcriptional regulator